MAKLNIQIAQSCDAPLIASVLKEAAQWLSVGGRPLWSDAEISEMRILRDTSNGLFYIAYDGVRAAGVMKFELEDFHFWPEVQPTTSAYVHKLAVRRAWAKRGVSKQLLSYAVDLARHFGRAYLRLDCVADRQGLRNLYEEFGFTLHSVVEIGRSSYARYELPISTER
ncbi:GNAT family N-acetyltransferase [Acidovorax sp.]|jgi:GNAT superfamily N-acetyltransferase|uniref:GNAT family N-acetyltransferase n=1 Tax=Acidovorax sp. TaxID=1872122 RepID=UPI00391F3752